MKTVIKLIGTGGELNRVEIPYDEASTMDIAKAVVSLVEGTGMSMHEGDSITVTTEE